MSTTGYTFPDAERIVPRFSEITDGPQQRIYERPLWDAIPLPLFAGAYSDTGLGNDNGVLMLLDPTGYPTDSAGLPRGAVYNNGFAIGVVPGLALPGPFLFFGRITAAQLLAVGGANLPPFSMGTGSNVLWNNDGIICVS